MEANRSRAVDSVSSGSSLMQVVGVRVWPESLRDHTFIGPARHYRCDLSERTKRGRPRESSDPRYAQVDIVELFAYQRASLLLVRVESPVLPTPSPTASSVVVESWRLKVWDKFLHAERAREVQILAGVAVPSAPRTAERNICSFFVYSAARKSGSSRTKDSALSKPLAASHTTAEAEEVMWKECSLHCAAVLRDDSMGRDSGSTEEDARLYQLDRLKDTERQISVVPASSDADDRENPLIFHSLDDCVSEWMNHTIGSRSNARYSCGDVRVEVGCGDEVAILILFLRVDVNAARGAGATVPGSTTSACSDLVVVGRCRWEVNDTRRSLFGKQAQRAQLVSVWRCAPVVFPVTAHLACMEWSSSKESVEMVAWEEEAEDVAADLVESLPSASEALATFHVGGGRGDGEPKHINVSSVNPAAARVRITQSSVKVSRDSGDTHFANPFRMGLLCYSEPYRTTPELGSRSTADPSAAHPCGAIVNGTLMIPVFISSGEHMLIHIPTAHLKAWGDPSPASSANAMPTGVAAHVSVFPISLRQPTAGGERSFCRVASLLSVPQKRTSSRKNMDQAVALVTSSCGSLLASSPLGDAIDVFDGVSPSSQGWMTIAETIHTQAHQQQSQQHQQQQQGSKLAHTDAKSVFKLMPVRERGTDEFDFGALLTTEEGCAVLGLLPCDMAGMSVNVVSSIATRTRDRVSCGDPALDLVWHLVNAALAEGESEASKADSHNGRLTALLREFFQRVSPALRFSGSPTREALLLMQGIQRVLSAAVSADGAAAAAAGEGERDRLTMDAHVNAVREALTRVRDDLQRPGTTGSSPHVADDSMVQLLRILVDGMRMELQGGASGGHVATRGGSHVAGPQTTGVFEAAVLVALADHRVDLIALAEETIPQMIACELAPPTTWVVEARENRGPLVHAVAIVLLCACFDVTVFVSADGLFHCCCRCGNANDTDEDTEEGDFSEDTNVEGVYVRRTPQVFPSQTDWERAAALSADLLSLTARDNLDFPLALAAFSLLATKRYHAFRTLVEMYPVHFTQYWDTYMESVSALDSVEALQRNPEGAARATRPNQEDDMKWLTACCVHVTASQQKMIRYLIGREGRAVALADVLANALHTAAEITTSGGDEVPSRVAHLFNAEAARQLAVCVPHVCLAVPVVAVLHVMTEHVVAAQNNYAVSVMKAYLSAEVGSGVERGELVPVEHRLQGNIPAPCGCDSVNAVVMPSRLHGAPSPCLLQCDVSWSRLVAVLNDARTAWTSAAPFLPCSLGDLEMLIIDISIRTTRDHGGLPQTLVAAMLSLRLVILCTVSAQLQMQVIAALRSQLRYTYSAERDGPAETSPPIATCIIALRAMYMLRGTAVPTLWFQDQVLSSVQLLIPLATQFSVVAAIACRVLSLSLAAASDHAPLKKRSYAIESVVRPLQKESAVPFMVESLLEDATKWPPSSREATQDAEDKLGSKQVTALLERLPWVRVHKYPRREFMINTSWTHTLWPVESTPAELEHAFEDIRSRAGADDEQEPTHSLTGVLARPLFDTVCSIITQHEPLLIASAADDADSFFRDPSLRHRRQKRAGEDGRRSAENTESDTDSRGGPVKGRLTALMPTNPPSPNRDGQPAQDERPHVAALPSSNAPPSRVVVPVGSFSLREGAGGGGEQVAAQRSPTDKSATVPPRRAADETTTSPIFDPSAIAWWEHVADGDNGVAESGSEALAVTDDARRRVDALRRTANGLGSGSGEGSDGSSTDEGTEGNEELAQDSSSLSSAGKSDTSSHFCHRHMKHHHRCERHRCRCACHAQHRKNGDGFRRSTPTATQTQEELIAPPQLLRFNGLPTPGALLAPSVGCDRSVAEPRPQQSTVPRTAINLSGAHTSQSPVPLAPARRLLTLPAEKTQPSTRVCLWVATQGTDGTPGLKGIRRGGSSVVAPWGCLEGDTYTDSGHALGLHPPPLPASSVFPQPLTLLSFRGNPGGALPLNEGAQEAISSKPPCPADGSLVDNKVRQSMQTEETQRLYTQLENELPVSMEKGGASRTAEDPFFKSFITGFGSANNAHLYSTAGSCEAGGSVTATSFSAPPRSDDTCEAPALSPSQKVAFRHYVNELLARQDGGESARGPPTDQILSALRQQRNLSGVSGVALSEAQQEFMRVLSTQQQAFFQVMCDGYDQQKQTSERIFKSAITDAFAESERRSLLSTAETAIKDATANVSTGAVTPTTSAVYNHAQILNEALEHRNHIARMNERLLGLQSIAVNQLAADSVRLGYGFGQTRSMTGGKEMISHETYALSDNDGEADHANAAAAQGMSQQILSFGGGGQATSGEGVPVAARTWTTTTQSAVNDTSEAPATSSLFPLPVSTAPILPREDGSSAVAAAAPLATARIDETAAELHRLSDVLAHISGSVEDMEKALAASQDVLSRYDYSRQLGALSTTMEQELALRSLRLRSSALEQELKETRGAPAADVGEADSSGRNAYAIPQEEERVSSDWQRDSCAPQPEKHVVAGEPTPSLAAVKPSSAGYRQLHTFTRSHVGSSMDEDQPISASLATSLRREGNMSDRGAVVDAACPTTSVFRRRPEECADDKNKAAEEEQVPAHGAVRFSGVTRVDVLPRDNSLDTDTVYSSARDERSLRTSASALSDSRLSSSPLPRARQQTLPPQGTAMSERRKSDARPVALHGLQDVYDNPSTLEARALSARSAPHRTPAQPPHKTVQKLSSQTQRSPPPTLRKKATVQLRRPSPDARIAKSRFDMYRPPERRSSAAESNIPHSSPHSSKAAGPGTLPAPPSALGNRRTGAASSIVHPEDSRSVRRNDERTRSLIHQLTSLQAAFDDTHV